MTTLSLRLALPLLLGTLVLGGIIGRYWLSPATVAVADGRQPALEQQQNASQKPEVLYWYDPMVPNQHFDQPGPSPFMDMDLVPKYAGANTSHTQQGAAFPSLKINPALVQNLGMRTAKVERKTVQAEWEVTGKLQFNARDQAILQLRAAGFVEKVWPLAEGDMVAAGQAIARLQVPAWLDAQNELLAQPLGDNPRLLVTLRARLQLLGMPDGLIAEVERTRLPVTGVTITAPIAGVITGLSIKTGMALDAGATLAQINAIDSLWLEAAIPESHAIDLTTGARACFFASNPNQPVLHGTVETLLPTIDANSRTLTARILLDNPNGELKPGTSGRVWLQSQTVSDELVVPTEAVIRTGLHTRIMRAEGDGRFSPVAVKIGAEIGDQTVIRSGLHEGDKVVVSGQFLLDSEASFMGLESAVDMEADHD